MTELYDAPIRKLDNEVIGQIAAGEWWNDRLRQ